MIAETALAERMPVITRDEPHFARVSDLRVVTY
jgi:predicted nucleic acid-binding protein